MIKFAEENKCILQLTAAMRSNDEAEIQAAWKALHESIAAHVLADVNESHDMEVLAQRGYRQLTTPEKKWYEKLITALKSPNPKQAFTAIIGSENEEDLMPTTIIEDVYKNLQEEYPLLQAFNFQYVGYITKWILNDHSAQNAVWGQITDEITKEITSSFKVINVNQNKLSAFAIIELGMLDMGAVFLDGYIRTVLKEAIMAGLETGAVSGTGVNEPIGLIRDISEGVSYSSTTGYPAKEKIAVNSFTPAEYGALIARMAKTENGHKRKFKEVGLIVNQTDYLTKVMPATTVQNALGTYVGEQFPFPTTVYISNAVEDGEAIIFLPQEYNMLMGGSKNGIIDYSDECRFLEDQRAFRIKQYGAGRAFDNTSALYLDISNLDPAYITVRNYEETVTA